MRTKTAVLVAFAFLLSIRSPAQSTIPWSTISTGFRVSSSGTSMVKSVVGQVFVGRVTGPSSIIESGFLADTLLRATDVSSSVSEREGIPKEYALSQNYPNPFNPSTTIRYGLPQRSHVNLAVHNTLGQQVAQLVNGETEAGYHEVKFDASALPSGVYFYRLQAGSYVETHKLCLVR
jgi:hypothetical protein